MQLPVYSGFAFSDNYRGKHVQVKKERQEESESEKLNQTVPNACYACYVCIQIHSSISVFEQHPETLKLCSHLQ